MKAQTFYELRTDIDRAYVWSTHAERAAIRVPAGIYLCIEAETKSNGEEVANILLAGAQRAWIIVATYWGPTPVGATVPASVTASVLFDPSARRAWLHTLQAGVRAARK